MSVMTPSLASKTPEEQLSSGQLLLGFLLDDLRFLLHHDVSINNDLRKSCSFGDDGKRERKSIRTESDGKARLDSFHG